MTIAMNNPSKQILSGEHHQLGANWDGEGVNFSLFSAHATRVDLCIFDATGQHQVAQYEMPRCTNHIWHGYLPGHSVGTVYAYRVHGPYDPQKGHRFNHHKLLLDPYAKKLVGDFSWSDCHFGYVKNGSSNMVNDDLSFDKRDNAQFMPKCVVTHQAKSYEGRPQKPRVKWQETTLYETHLRGFTMRHPDVPELERGKFLGFSHTKVIDYIKALGVSSIEILPVHQFIDENFLAQKGLRNYWGYNTLNYFAPHAGYQVNDGLAEFQQMVDCYHDAGLEVILDVVYNHTAESNHLGPTLSFRGIDNVSYYHLQAEQPRFYVNDTGCGNTVNAQHPAVVRLILDSLRHWSTDMGVDGFRFDLATTLGRKKKGFSRHANVFQAIAQDPELSQAKLIAEPWDIGPGGYQLGNFPSGWSEWNDSYRDVCRKFWRREAGVLPTFARRIHGSSDVFEHSGKDPYASINFITSHDGFTLNDLVSYKERHNQANGESNRDGHSDNISQNFGVEGPTSDPEVNEGRQRQMRNMLATLLLSQGVPMLRGGDELGQSQLGNNNAYCQDNELSWLDWSDLNNGTDVLGEHGNYIARLIQIARDFPMLRNHEFLHPPKTHDGIVIEWLNADGEEKRQEHWAQHQDFLLGYKLSNCIEQCDVLIVFNNHSSTRAFKLPATDSGEPWHWLLDSNNASGESAASAVIGDSTIDISAASVAVLSSQPAGLTKNV